MSFIKAGLWGLKVEAGKDYSQIVDQHFVISMAALAATLPKNGSRTSITVTAEENEFVICSLTPGKIEQQTIDLTFLEGSEIVIRSVGNCSIDLTGNYLVDLTESDDGYDSEESMDSNDRRQWLAEHGGMDDDSEDEDEEDSEADEVEIAEALNGKRKLAAIPAASAATKKAKITEIVEEAAPKKAAAATPVTKKEIAAAKKAEAAAKKAASPKEATPAKAVKESPAAKKAASPATPAAAAAAATPKSTKKVLPNGLAIEDAVVGTGAQAKNGKKVGVRYIGRLAKNGKVFDSNTKGQVFKFKLGNGEVIKGWDLGVAGMNIGGTRKLTIPAALAYGSRGAPPDIPPNSTLEFEVKLLEVR